MKRTQIAMALLALLSSCCNERSNSIPSPVTSHPGFVPVDTANKMISSYVNSINYTANDTDLRSLTISAAELRYYLDSLPNSSSIKNVEIKFAHKQSYINAGNQNQPAGLKASALTVIIAGLDQLGGYIYADQHVINRAGPCPINCPPSGPMLTP